MKRLIQILLTLFLAAYAAGAMAATDVRGLIREGIQELGVEKGARELCAVTDATYVKLKGETTEGYVDIIREETGCSVGRGNLLFFHRPVDYPLVIALQREDTGEAFLVKKDGEQTKTTWFNIAGDRAGNPEHYGELMDLLGGDTFSVVTILTSHAKGAPFDFLKCCEYHNHYCPGLTSGYLIARLIRNRYPTGPGEQYIWFACPPWCKDDAVSTALDVTPGKRSLYVKAMAEGQPTEGRKGRWAGVMVIWNGKDKTGRAVVLQYDFKGALAPAGLEPSDLRPKGGKTNPAFFTARIKSAWALIPCLDQPERFVSVAEAVEVTPAMLKKMKMAGVDPYEVLGIDR